MNPFTRRRPQPKPVDHDVAEQLAREDTLAGVLAWLDEHRARLDAMTQATDEYSALITEAITRHSPDAPLSSIARNRHERRRLAAIARQVVGHAPNRKEPACKPA